MPSLFLFASPEIHKNVISPLDGDTKEAELHKKHTDLKQKMRDINHGFERLRKLSHEGFTEDSGERGENRARSERLRCRLAVSQVIRDVLLHVGKRFWERRGQNPAFCQRCPAGPYKSCALHLGEHSFSLL